jgi:hypothetical protein
MSESIQVQQTPNPNARKFTLTGVRFEGSINYASATEAAANPLARALFALDGVYNVFTAQDFVTVNKRADVAWDALEAPICRLLTEHFTDHFAQKTG